MRFNPGGEADANIGLVGCDRARRFESSVIGATPILNYARRHRQHYREHVEWRTEGLLGS